MKGKPVERNLYEHPFGTGVHYSPFGSFGETFVLGEYSVKFQCGFPTDMHRIFTSIKSVL